jgi:DNA-binding NarL/FixJ family response regulator
MAEQLGVSVNTVRTHVSSVLRKLHAHHRSMAVSTAFQLGLVQVA